MGVVDTGTNNKGAYFMNYQQLLHSPQKMTQLSVHNRIISAFLYSQQQLLPLR